MNDAKILTRSVSQINAQNEEFFGRDVIVVFARAPVPGQVKTRLAKTMGMEKAAQLYAAMLRDCLDLAKRAARKEGNCAVVLCYWPPNAFDEGEFSLQPFWSGARLAQSEGDLGEKIWQCLRYFNYAGANRIIVIGSDSPDLLSGHINGAFHSLTEKKMVFTNGQEYIVPRHLVLGPTRDGGFYLLGIQGEIPHALFADVEWSTSDTLRQIRENAAHLQISGSHREFQVWEDVDTPGDLRRLIARLGNDLRPRTTLKAVHVARWLFSENLL